MATEEGLVQRDGQSRRTVGNRISAVADFTPNNVQGQGSNVIIRALSDGDNMSYEVVDTGNGFLIVSKVRDSTGVRSVVCTKRQWDNEFLEKLADGLNREPTSASYQISLSVLSKYEFAL